MSENNNSKKNNKKNNGKNNENNNKNQFYFFNKWYELRKINYLFMKNTEEKKNFFRIFLYI